jgi:hypothetical protein
MLCNFADRARGPGNPAEAIVRSAVGSSPESRCIVVWLDGSSAGEHDLPPLGYQEEWIKLPTSLVFSALYSNLVDYNSTYSNYSDIYLNI